jgi:hypothetical protein
VVIGHADIVARVEAEKPPVSLFLGPSSVGKWTVAEYLRGVWRVDEGDTLRIDHLNTATARMVVHFASHAPSRDRRLAIIQLTDAGAHALHILLKTLEEGLGSTDFILIAEESPLATIASRASVYRFGFLTEPEVAEVLTGRNFQPEDAAQYASMSGGQVSRALSVVNNRDVKQGVMQAVKAFREMDPIALESASKEWTDEHSTLLAQWCRESLTGRTRIFSTEEILDSRRIPFKVLQALNANVRPRLLLRSNLMSVLRQEA